MWLVARVVGLQLGQARQGILAVKAAELGVHLWITVGQQIRGTEEILAGNGKEFRRVFRGVGVYFCLGVRVGVELAVEVIEGALHHAGPFLHAHVVVQGRQAVGVAVEHVQLVGQFVDDQVVAFPLTAGEYAGPGQDDRALLPGFAAVFTVPLVLDAAGVAMALRAEEVVGV